MTTYPFVPSPFNYGKLKAHPLGLMIHMAEGGGTVAYLANNPARGVSVHFVCEYSGRIVQMVPLDQATGSLNPNLTRTDDGPPPYGRTSLDAVLGTWATDPNNAVISVETEGFAAKGPNPQQRAALAMWAQDMRTRLPTLTGALGHRDQQNYKACPGAFVDWASLGGHGLWHGSGPDVPGDDVKFVSADGYGTTSTQLINTGPNHEWLYLDGSHGGTIAAAAALACFGSADGHPGNWVCEITTGTPYVDKVARPTLVLVQSSNKPYPAPTPPTPTPVDCQPQIDAAVNAALDHVATPAAATVTAIGEARPR